MLNEGDKAECKDIARLIVKEVILEHIQSCPIGRSLAVSKAFLSGCVFIAGCGGGAVGAIIARVMGK